MVALWTVTYVLCCVYPVKGGQWQNETYQRDVDQLEVIFIGLLCQIRLHTCQ